MHALLCCRFVKSHRRTATLTSTTTTDEVHSVLCQRFRILGMTCGHCERAVGDEVRKVAGVASVRVSAYTGTVTIETDREVTEDAVVRAVNEAGYQVVRPGSPADRPAQGRSKVSGVS